MAYATRKDIIQLYGEDALLVADRGGDVADVGAAVTRALHQASDQMDAYLRVKYEDRVPISPVPWLLTQMAVDIAIYRLAPTADVLSDEIKSRYEDAIAQLKQLAAGTMVLPDPRAPDQMPDPERPVPIISSGPERHFTRDKLSGL